MREKSAQAGLHTGIPSCVARRKLVTSASYSTPVAPGGAESQGVGKYDSSLEKPLALTGLFFDPMLFT
jgi:hypothetical protein